MHMQHSDMNEEMRVEAMELCVTACEKHSASNEVQNHSNNIIVTYETNTIRLICMDIRLCMKRLCSFYILPQPILNLYMELFRSIQE